VIANAQALMDIRDTSANDAARIRAVLALEELVGARDGRGTTVTVNTAVGVSPDKTPTAALIRQVLGAVAFEKAALVAKLKAARERKKAETGKCGGRRSVAEANPTTVALAKKLARYPVNGHRRSLREVAAELASAGHLTSAGTRYGAAAVARMIAA
jgi:hypothetical protein